MGIRGLLTALSGAAVWLGIVLTRLRSAPETLWIARDDAVITLSHARNAAEFGSIGVSPGDRTEGFSSPLHFLVAYLVELVSEPGYRTLSIWLIVAASAVTGAAVAVILRSIALERGVDSWVTLVTVIGMTAVAAGWVVSSWSTVGWIGSGMENPVVVAAGMTAIAIAVAPHGGRRSQVGLVIALTAFAVGRVEFAAFVVPLILAAAWHHGDGRRRRFIETAGAVLVLIALVHIARRLYFGDWLPNTAVVQGRTEGRNRLLIIALLGAAVLASTVAIAIGSDKLRVPSRPRAGRQLAGIAAVLVAIVAALSLLDQSAGHMVAFVWLPPLPPLGLAVVTLCLVGYWFGERVLMTDAVLLAAAAVPLAQFIAMGEARLDADRVSSMAVPFLAVWVSSMILRLVLRVLEPASLPSQLAGSRRFAMLGLVGCGVLVSWAAISVFDETRRLNWEISGAQEIIDVVDEYQAQHLGEGLVILANPDLGKVSYEKNALMVDLGWLGDPLLTRLTASRRDLVAPYLQFIAGPDVVESHGRWSCTYKPWLISETFAATYVPTNPAVVGAIDPSPDGCAFDGERIIWVRSGPQATAEHALVEQLIAADDPVPIVRDAVAACALPTPDTFRCQGVRRSLQRASVQLRDAGTYDDAVAAMQASPSFRFDAPVLLRGPGWADEAHDALIALVGG